MSEKPKYLGKCPTCGVIVRRHGDYCSSGCHLAGKLPLTEEGLPATWQLGVILATFFALFNQLMFWLLAYRKLQEGELDLATKFGWASLGLGFAILLFWVFIYIIARFKTWVDIAVLLLSLGVMTIAIRGGSGIMSIENLQYFFYGNCFLAIWFGRGLFALWLSKKRENRA
ncbi:MAG: hypothetical protein AAGB46_11450 [Verrucomicrobiota bacterium]